MEVLLLHSSLLQEGSFFTSLINTLRRNKVNKAFCTQLIKFYLRHFKVVIHPGPRLHSVLPISSDPVQSLRHEYSSLECCVEIVDSAEEAVDYINTNSSHHTDSVITENGTVCVYVCVCVYVHVCTCKCVCDGVLYTLGDEQMSNTH